MHPVRKSRNDFKRKPLAPIPTVALSQFRLFQTLPLEVRQMVWSIAIPGQRAIHLIPRHASKTTNRDDRTSDEAYRLCYGSRGFTDHIPTILLHVCKESRNFAPSRYRPFLGSLLGDLPIYFDFEGDTLLFNGNAEWKYMTNLSGEEREAEKERVLRIAAKMEAMLEEVRNEQSINQDTLSDTEEDSFTDVSSDEGFSDDEDETEGAAYESDQDSLPGVDDTASDNLEDFAAHGTEGVDFSEEKVVGLNYLFESCSTQNNVDFALENDLDSIFGDDTSSEDADEEIPTPTFHLRGGAGYLFGDDKSENAMDINGVQVDIAWDPLPIRTLAALRMARNTLMGLADPSVRIADLDDQREGEKDYGSDLDSPFGH